MVPKSRKILLSGRISTLAFRMHWQLHKLTTPLNNTKLTLKTLSVNFPSAEYPEHDAHKVFAESPLCIKGVTHNAYNTR